MIASELRIGNWVQNGPFIGRVSNVGDTAFLDFKGCEPFNNGNSIKFHEAYFDEDEFRPIPLTEEWLIKFGFVKNDYPWGGWVSPPCNDSLAMIRIDIDNQTGCMKWHANAFQTIQIQYVHQLQNLYFTLTGTELTIKE